MWVIEATLKQGFRHIYSRRTDYADEDSWQILIADRYDARGQLWRTALAMAQEAPEVPLMGADGYEFLDLIQHRYLLQGMHNQEPKAPIYNSTTITPTSTRPKRCVATGVGRVASGGQGLCPWPPSRRRRANRTTGRHALVGVQGAKPPVAEGTLLTRRGAGG